jgi:predicted nucleic acid-binding Zn ribbon protein
MGIFELKCNECGMIKEVICARSKLDEVVSETLCECGGDMKRIMSTCEHQYGRQNTTVKFKDVRQHYKKMADDAKHAATNRKKTVG